eukprot:4310433-Amphidinium_carterae.1
MYTRYECFVGGRGQNKIKCHRCSRKSDMFSHFIFVSGKALPSGETQWDPATIDDADFQKALDMTRGKDPKAQ